TYLVLVHGDFRREVDATGFLIADTHSAVHKKRRFVTALPEGAANVENCRTLLSPAGVPAPGFSLVRARLFTGRMHQIRATMCSLGYPVVGDKLYGRDERLFLKIRDGEFTDGDKRLLVLPRQALHSAELEFNHPVTGERMTFRSPVPEMFSHLPGGDAPCP
ncbi:MAG: RluA family pseudouridine synthase, partial [Lentisphaeria bacterium]|nr:RluA family pseudouridine synthase [Lentisphaeria bacterium]